MKKFLTYIKGHETTYLLIWIVLLCLTTVTVWVSYFNFGIFNILVAMLIATIKATLVCLYFMHLKYDNRVNQVVFTSSFVFLAIFIGLTGSDLFYRKVPTSEKIKLADMGLVQKHHTEDPSIVTQSSMDRGKALYQTYCLSCHALDRSFFGNPKDVFHIISDGLPGTTMPSFLDLGEKERWALTHFVLSNKK